MAVHYYTSVIIKSQCPGRVQACKYTYLNKVPFKKVNLNVTTSTPKVYSCNDPKSPISQVILDLIKKKRRLRWLYNNTQGPNIQSTINKLQKEIRTKINQESTISWEKFFNSISLESDPKKSWRKITNFPKPKGPRSYPSSN